MLQNEDILFMLLLGCRPSGRNTEQHDIFFGIGKTLRDLVPAIKKSWPEAKGNIHIDAWRKIRNVDGYPIKVAMKQSTIPIQQRERELFFINLGGYKENQFDEVHYKMLIVAANLEEAKAKARKTAFYQHTSVSPSANTQHATAHIDDKFAIDVDDAYPLKDILSAEFKVQYQLIISAQDPTLREDELHLGYYRLTDI
jgi:Domain of Unknown Function (DUF1543)